MKHLRAKTVARGLCAQRAAGVPVRTFKPKREAAEHPLPLAQAVDAEIKRHLARKGGQMVTRFGSLSQPPWAGEVGGD